jgi:hypothetical protein
MLMTIRKCAQLSGDSGAMVADSGIGLEYDDEEEIDLIYDDASEDEGWSPGKSSLASKRLEMKKLGGLRVV